MEIFVKKMTLMTGFVVHGHICDGQLYFNTSGLGDRCKWQA